MYTNCKERGVLVTKENCKNRILRSRGLLMRLNGTIIAIFVERHPQTSFL